jgi:DNA repair protein RadA/Sms
VQTFGTSLADGSPGSITQVRACTARLMETAKTLGIIIVLIGHVTKDGTVAGPKTLEHMVDTVLYLEGDANHELRLLRAVKNRFGSTDEVGMFEMREDGLGDMKNVSEELLRERGDASPGSVVTCLIEGTRPILIEVQALVNKTVFGYPVRKASGFDINRLHVLIAVLERRAGLNLSAYDVHLNIVGGVRADEPATDLAVCLAIASAYKDKPLAKDIAAFGEVGLAGEVRSVRFTEKRLRECAKLGMKKVYTKNTKFKSDDIQIVSVKNIQDLISHTK